MLSFANPEYLYLLLLIPLIALLYWLSRRARTKKIKRFGRPEQVSDLMPEVSKYKPWIRLIFQLLILTAVIFILARPRGGAKVTNTTVNGIEVMIAMDVSNSMDAACADDMPNVSRLQRSKLVLQKLIDRLTGNKVGLIVFAGNSYMQMPLTGDAQSAKMYLNNISTGMAPSQGTAIGSTIMMSRSAFSKNPRTQKAIIVITDGENFEDDAEGAAKDARKAGIQVNVVGIGSVKGALIPRAEGGFMTDENGEQVVTKLNEEMAQKIASTGNGTYVNGSASDAVDNLYESLQKLSKTNMGSYSYSQQDEQFPVFAWIALILMFIELLIMDRKNPFLKKYNFFTKGNKNENQDK